MSNDVRIEIPPFPFALAGKINFAQALNDNLSSRVKESMQSPQNEKKQAAMLLSRILTLDNSNNEDIVAWRELQRMVVEATQSIYLEQNNKIETLEKTMEKRWTKKKAAVVTGSCTVLSTVITALFTFLVEKYF
jgi:predicted house-cleaning noncanonical NTP pyrophosphatase (MazG superfamily)